MTIRKKLLLSYIGMIFIPLVLFFPVAMLLMGMFMKDIQGVSEYREDTSQRWVPAMKEMFEKRDELYAGIKYMARYDPIRLTDTAFLQKTDAEFNSVQTGLVMIKQDRIVYVSPFLEGVDLSVALASGQEDAGHHGFQFRGLDRNFTVEQYRFTFPDQQSGTIYALSDTKSLFAFFSKFFPLLFLALLLIIGLTNVLLTYLVSRSIIKPIYALKQAALQIKEGNLDHEVTAHKKDEIGELSTAFEEMRCRLKESIHLQLQYEENRKQLLSNISHDLKTPITGIKGCVEGILDGVAHTKEKQAKYLNMIYKKANDMDRMIEELFLYSKLDMKRLPFHFEELDIVTFIKDYVEEIRLDPQMKGVFVTLSSENDEPILIWADREKLNRVMMNIVDNSLKHMRGEVREIRMELVDTAQEITVKIADNGSGIEPEALPHIFERFYRAEPSRSPANGGSGLGLAIVKHIIDEHGGRIWAESAVGRGTTVAFTLPKRMGLVS
ncbi:sensor histidine kinase [Brevibacillus migulae]|uniref:sensor histidine kinase n=1 Tax=Brevibacillus migulae TaxID=1644114 RepID=UPI00106EA0CC|nr:HAMP domain-containing sensor histidine kinase [Brevibacillus migulae]